MKRKGLGLNKGMGYYNIVPKDPYIHSLSAKGVKTKCGLKKVFGLNARSSMTSFKLNPEYDIVCYSEGTRNGFRHVAILMKNGYEVNKATANYLNRTWESYEYESVIYKLLHKSFPTDEADHMNTVFDENRKLGWK